MFSDLLLLVSVVSYVILCTYQQHCYSLCSYCSKWKVACFIVLPMMLNTIVIMVLSTDILSLCLLPRVDNV